MREIDEILAVEPLMQTARNWKYWKKVRDNFPAIVDRMKRLEGALLDIETTEDLEFAKDCAGRALRGK